MRLIFFAQDNCPEDNTGGSYLRFALSADPLAEMVLTNLSRHLCKERGRHPSAHAGTDSREGFFPVDSVVYALPKSWAADLETRPRNTITYTSDIPIGNMDVKSDKRCQWFILSNGRFSTQLNCELVEAVLKNSRADLLAINVTPALMAYRLNVRLTTRGNVIGFRRAYSDSVEPVLTPSDWPHHLFIKVDIVEHLPPIRPVSGSFGEFAQACQSAHLRLSCVNIAGSVLDLEDEDGLLAFCSDNIALFFRNHNIISSSCSRTNAVTSRDSTELAEGKIADNIRLVGRVLLGKNVSIGSGVVIIGPTIIADNARIESGATISSSIIGPYASILPNQLVHERIVSACRSEKTFPADVDRIARYMRDRWITSSSRLQHQVFREWPPFSYVRCAKRIADIIVSLVVIILFAPIIPLITLAIKLNSRGPVFYKDERQGLHGRSFDCIKFRTMRVGAHAIQEKLRHVSEVDGPQFKISDDPRITTVGRFLRETYVDEIPQFFNVLLGHMSVVGPRPSPEAENTQCPWWRDARLSVRPGITGLWQVCRTRQPMLDFQEWIFFDTKYVRELSLKLDLWICWRTVKKLIRNFIAQF